MYSSKGKHFSKSKSKDKDKRRPSKGGYKKNKARAMHYKVLGQIQHRKSVAKDPKMVAIVLLLPFIFG
jgi:hypothetical protein